jgi:hypothetical protein
MEEGDVELALYKADYEPFVPVIISIGGKTSTQPFNATLTEDRKFDFTGVVTDSDTEAVLSGVTVSVQSGETVTTDSKGAYTLSNLKKGNYSLTFEKDDYITFDAEITLAKDAATTLNVALVHYSSSLTGSVTDKETGKAVASVSVYATASVPSSTVTTNSSGDYTISGLKETKYTIHASKTGYNDYTATVSVDIKASSNTHDIALIPIPVPDPFSKAEVALSKSLAISSGIYYWFSPNSTTKTYYWNTYAPGSLPSTDAAIISDVVANGVKSDVADKEGWTYNTQASTKYTLYVIAYDSKGLRGENLIKKEITTLSATNQPRASMKINSIQSNSVSVTVTKVNDCYRYRMGGWYNLAAEQLALPDIYWAANASSAEINTEFTTWSFTGWNSSPRCALVTLGYDSKGNNSGVIDVAFFNTATGQTITRGSTRSTGELQMMKKAEQNEVIIPLRRTN